MWNLLAGYSGLISLGQQMFIGLGGYTLAVLSVYYGLPLWLGIFVGAVISVLFALLISLPIFRMGGMYFAIGTWMIAEALGVSFSNWEYVGYGAGISIRSAYDLPFSTLYFSALALMVVAILVVYAILRSKLGLALKAIRDGQQAAETLGINIFRSKLYTFLIAAFITGAASGVYYLYNVFIRPVSAFSISWTIALTFMVIIGGIGTIEGPIIGSIIYVLIGQSLAEYGPISLIVLGVITIVVILIFPKGIVGSIQEKYHIYLFPTRFSYEEGDG
jgi:branched-chain amino acid transport system permease protein